MKLLAGGFDPRGIEQRYQGAELRLLRDEAAARRAELLKPKARRRFEKQVDDAAQGVFE